jgi:hypothetical protein
MEYRLHNRGAGGVTIVVAVDGDAPPAPWLQGYFEEAIANGQEFRADETIQIGWSIVTLKSVGNELEVHEPTFDALPLVWRRGANNTLRHLILQQTICKQLGCEPQFPTIQQAGIVAPGLVERAMPTFEMSRDAASNNDSGWVFSPLGYTGEQAEYRSLYEVGVALSSVIPFLALPSGALVTKLHAELEIELDGHVLTSKSNPFLRQLVEPAASA